MKPPTRRAEVRVPTVTPTSPDYALHNLATGALTECADLAILLRRLAADPLTPHLLTVADHTTTDPARALAPHFTALGIPPGAALLHSQQLLTRLQEAGFTLVHHEPHL